MVTRIFILPMQTPCLPRFLVYEMTIVETGHQRDVSSEFMVIMPYQPPFACKRVDPLMPLYSSLGCVHWDRRMRWNNE